MDYENMDVDDVGPRVTVREVGAASWILLILSSLTARFLGRQ